MSGFDIIDNRMVITYGGRTVSSTDGTLLQFLSSEVEYTFNLSFPDANKGQIYLFGGSIQRAPGDNFFGIRRAQSMVGALPQEWSNTATIAAKVAGADLFVGRFSATRTVSPTHTWMTQTITPLIPTGQFVQINGGSAIVEAAAGICRSITFDVDASNLIVKQQQSVGPVAGGFGSSGVPIAIPSTSIPPNNITSGFENIGVSGEAFPVWWSSSAPYYIDEGVPSVGGTPPGRTSQVFANNARYGNPNAVPYLDPTDYTSTYSFTLRGRYGRRS